MVDGTVQSRVAGRAHAEQVSALVRLAFATVNAKVTGPTLLYTVPAGRSGVVTHVVPRCDAADAIVTGPTLGVGTNGGHDDIVAPTVVALTVAGTHVVLTPVSGAPVLSAGAQVYCGVDVAAVGTSQSLILDVFGYTY